MQIDPSKLSSNDLQALLEEAQKRSLLTTNTVIWPEGMRDLNVDSFFRWLANTKTWNEADKQSQSYPDTPYLRELCFWWFYCFRNGKSLVIEKSRRMVVSWLLRALELYCMGLGRMDGAIVNNDRSDAAKHCWRYQHLYEYLMKHTDWGLQAPSIQRERGNFQIQEIELPNKSRATIINADESSFPGEGFGFVVCEEISRYRASAEVWAQSKIVTQGAAGARGGFTSCVTNANGSNEGWQEIKAGWKTAEQKALRNKDIDGMSVRELPSGAIYVRIHHNADPAKDQLWLDRVARELPARQFRREILLDEDIYDGEPVFSEFDFDFHAPARFRNAIIKPINGARYGGGWDLGNTLNPAFCLAMFYKGQMCVVLEVVAHAPMQFSNFCGLVKEKLKAYLPGEWMDVLHVGDPAGLARNNEGRSAVDIAAEFGFKIKPARTNNIEARIDAVGAILREYIAQEGDEDSWVRAFSICQSGAPTLTEALKGAYCYQKRKNAGMYAQPMKNHYSHVSDSLQYLALEAPGMMGIRKQREARSYANV